jgi:HEAT repeat protein
MPLVVSKANSATPRPDAPSALDSASADERWAAARAAVDPSMVPSLAQALAAEGDTRVREAIFTALARIANNESALAVLPFVRSDDANIRAGALGALRAMPRAAKPHLPRLLADEDADVRLLVCDLVREMGDAEGAGWLCSLLEIESHANVCAAGIEALAEIGDRDALPVFLRCAARFPNDPFLRFAIKVAVDRLSARTSAFRD